MSIFEYTNETLMKIITQNDKLVDIVRYDFMLFSVLNRLGIDIAYGELTIRDACELKGLDTNFVVVVINTYLDEQYTPSSKEMNIPLDELIFYLEKSHLAYRDEFLPFLKQLFAALRELSPDSGVSMVDDIYIKAEKKFILHNLYEDEVVYPYVMDILNGENVIMDKDINEFINLSEEFHHNNFNEEVNDLLNIFLKYVNPTCPAEMGKFVGVLISFIRDLVHHMAIEDRYFYSRVKKMIYG